MSSKISSHWEDPSVDQLLNCFQEIGTQIPFWTQAQGSNLSVKVGDQLLIKPSGYRLCDVKGKADLAGLSLSSLHSFLWASQQKNKDEVAYATLLGQAQNHEGKACRGSMETGFHALLPGKFVFHFHSLAAIVMAAMYFNQEPKFLEWLDSTKAKYFNSTQIQFLPFVMPGLQLSYELAEKNSQQNSSVILMANHGVVLHFDDFSVFESWKKFECCFFKDFLNLDFPELMKWQIREIINKFNCEMPLKIFFPDMAVFREKMIPLLAGSGKEAAMNKLSISVVEQNRDLAELWLATMILYQIYPNLIEIDTNMGTQISQLPTEQFRKGKNQNDS